MIGVSLRRVPHGLPGAGMAVGRLHYSADPSRWSPELLDKLRATYTSDARWRREMEIEYEALEGELLYPEFNRDRNLQEPFDVSDTEYWTIWMALDPHPRTAHAMIWEAFNKHNDRVICGEFWPEFGTYYGPVDGARWKTRDYAEAIKFFESDSEIKGEPFVWARGKRLKVYRRLMDTFGAAANSDEGEDYFETYRRLGKELGINLYFAPALKGHENLSKAQDAIGRVLAPSKQGPPILRVFDNCYETIDEFENVRFPKPTRRLGDDFGSDLSAGRESDENVVTYQKHELDCLAYIETARPRYILPRRGGGGSSFTPIYPATGY